MIYLYDESGSPIGMQYRNTGYTANSFTTFYFEKNLQGDIVAIYNANGVKVLSYTYDAWGNMTVATTSGNTTLENGIVRTLNPFRYRGYYYDTETGLYYLQSRYYNPAWGRFLNTDFAEVIGNESTLTDKNLYAYCDNNPIMRVDEDGEFWITVGIMAIGGVIGGVISAVSSAITQNMFTGEINWASVGVAAISGFVSGAISASPLGLPAQMIAGGIIGGASYAADAYVNDSAITLDGFVLSVGMGILSGRIGGKGANHKMELTNAIKSAKATIARENRRANQKYAQKVIAQTISRRNNTLSYAMWEGSAKFVFGTGISNVTTTWYGENSIFDMLPSWKPW